MDTRRQSGLWQQNPATGYYEQAQTRSSALQGPYQYYQPPPRRSDTNASSNDRRSFSERAGNALPSEPAGGAGEGGGGGFLASAQNTITGLGKGGGGGVGAGLGAGVLIAQSAAQKVTLPMEHFELLGKMHEMGGDAGPEHFAKTAHASSAPHRIAEAESVAAGGSRGAAPPLAVDTLDDDVPENLRTQAWSPDITSPLDQKSKQANDATAMAADSTRRGSVPDKSPLQKLEMEASKEEKRARVADAEHRARQRSLAGEGDLARTGTLRHEKGRAVSDGSRRPTESMSDKYYQHSPRQVSGGSTGAAPPPTVSRDARIAAAPTAAISPPIKREARPYHHAPEIPRSMDSQRRRERERDSSAPMPHSRSNGAAAYRQPTSDIANNPRPYHHAPEEPRDLNHAQYPHNAHRFSGEEPRRRSEDIPRRSTDYSKDAAGGGLDRSASQYANGKYKHRARDAGYVGAAAAAAGAAGGMAYSNRSDSSAAADRGKAAYERYRNKQQQPQTQPTQTRDNSYSSSGQQTQMQSTKNREQPFSSQQQQREYAAQDSSPITPNAARDASFGDDNSVNRSSSKKLQKRAPPSEQWRNRGPSLDAEKRDQDLGIAAGAGAGAAALGAGTVMGMQSLQSDRMGGKSAVAEHKMEPDPVTRDSVATGKGVAVPYKIPPQTAAGQAAREQVGFDQGQNGVDQHQGLGAGAAAVDGEKSHRLGGLLHHGDKTGGPRSYQAGKAPLEEWRTAQVGRLSTEDLEFENATTTGSDDAWWEKDGKKRSSTSGTASSSRQQPSLGAAQYDGPYEEEAKLFQPPMFLKCGPLLRYTGIRREQSSSSGGAARDIWRGSIMIVTEDEQSDYSPAPTLRLFAQPMELHQPPPKSLVESGQEIPPEYEDPVAGQVKISRTGRPLYVRPVHDIDGGVDLSRMENNSGLYAAVRTPVLGPQFSAGPDGRQSPHIAFQDKGRVKGRDGEKAGRFKEVQAIRLHNERGFTFWRWSIEIELGSTQYRVAYRINRGPALGFWVPGRGETMHTMFHSCNGFSLSVDPNNFSGPDPLWRNVLNRHQARPFHVMIGGGDQIYNDCAIRDTQLFRDWLQTKSPEHKRSADFTPEMQDELENFYMERYSMWFSQGLFAMAGSQIPMVNVWDDHDIIDGYGSYPHHFMSTPVFTGLGAIAFKYYMLFQHQSVPAETAKEEPSWILGASRGPYINELSRSVFMSLGTKVKFLGLDCRTERMRDEILSQETYDILFNRCRAEIQNGETKHLIVLLGVPIAYPRLNFLENILTSRVMDPIKALGRTGMLGGFVNKFDGGVEILDDLDDHWTAKHHKAERNWFIQELQQLAAEKSVRVTILGGDVHLGAVGQFYTPKKFGVGKDKDHRYMPNVISSAIVNTPPPTMMADVLNRRNKIHHLDSETDEDLIPMFEYDVDGSKRNNRHLLPRRNYCTIKEFHPGNTPPSTPPPERSGTQTPQDGFADGYEKEERDRRFPPGSMRRTRSLTGGAANLVRRLSGSRSRNPPLSLGQNGRAASGLGRSNSMDAARPSATQDATPDLQQRPGFYRRPTALSEKEIRRAISKGGAPDEEGEQNVEVEPGHINLEGGLDVCLNMEVDQNDPSGTTQPYRMLVPALWYTGAPDVNTSRFKSRGAGLVSRFRGRGKKDGEQDGDYSDDDGEDDDPNAPPSRGNVQAAAAPVGGPGWTPSAAATGGARQQKASYGNDGAYDNMRNGNAAERRSMEQTGAAYGQGLSLSSPPIGAPQQSRSAAGPPPSQGNNPYPQSWRRSNVPVSQKHSQQGPHDREQDEYSEGSLTPSDEYVDAPTGRSPTGQQRRMSKAERFFGLGDNRDDGGYVDGYPEKRKASWKIWR